MKSIFFFDFLSTDNMHLPFNSGYLKTLRNAFPDDEIIFCAQRGHVENIQEYLADEDAITLRVCDGFDHRARVNQYPVTSAFSAYRYVKDVRRFIKGKNLRLLSIGGVEAALLRTFKRFGSSLTKAPLHYILHGQLGGTFAWRSRNPLHRWFDFRAEFMRGLPENQKWVALEKGIEDAVISLVPSLKGQIITLPHPLINYPVSENEVLKAERPIRFAYIGVCSKLKGFEAFRDLALRLTDENREFWVIGSKGKAYADDDFSMFKQEPADDFLEADQFYRMLKQVDVIVLPFEEGYNYISSGSMLDAVSFLKPVMTVKSSNYRHMLADYGEFGPLVSDLSQIEEAVAGLTFEGYQQKCDSWIDVLERIRDERRPEWLAQGYRKTLAP
ncbi:hypothetical protein [Kordiimonas laminariae]|uniref:hypothetical protein n=1 Tax=Kordiimonas laminariae TaxID=2917717 RepID=UPI001FF54AFF|nr:hypothetical protein [Kordiimonas laminariae]MCK0070912.1 hypothetical protein [Kordiimonas laminariae]